MVSEYQENRFFNDEKDGDSPELTRAKRAFNKALRREYSRRNGYDEDGDYIGTDNNQRVPGSFFLSGLRLGNRQEETPSQGVRLALNDYTNSMSDGSFRLAQSNSDKLGVNWIYDDADSFVYGGSSQPYTCDFFMNSNKIYEADKHRSKIVDGSTINAMAERLAKDKNYLNTQKEQAYKKCLEANKSKKYCDKFADSIFQCYKDALEDASQNKDFFDKMKGEYKENYFKEFLRSIGIFS